MRENPSLDLRTVFATPNLQRLAAPRSYSRGLGYSGMVRRLQIADDAASAIVRGTHDYRVRLWVEDGGPGFECSCPMGFAGEFCKHCVAVGLALTDAETEAVSAGPSKGEMRSYLGGLDKDVLVDLVLELAEGDDFLAGRIQLAAARSGSGGVNLDAFRQAIDDAILVHDYIAYRDAYAYSENIGRVIGSIRDLVSTGSAEAAVTLCEHALAALEEALGMVDDSDGYLGSRLNELTDLHHVACETARPDPAALAERLFQWELHSEWDTFYDGAAVYADILGSEGLAAYRVLAEDVWAGIAERGAGGGREFSRFRSSITHIMETLARISGNVDELVAVMARDLSHPYDYLRIADVLVETGRHDEALEWAERGLAEFPDRLDGPLAEFAADEYHRRGLPDQAMNLVWEMFFARPGINTYQRLHHHATMAGVWADWRDKALGHLRAHVVGEAGPTPRWGWPRDSSSLVEVFLWENEVDSAWVEAQQGGCSKELWMRLAVAREKHHPADSLPIFRDHVETLIQQKKNHSYAEAVEWMVKVRALFRQMGREEEFAAYATDVRVRHKPKRNLMKLFDTAGW